MGDRLVITIAVERDGKELIGITSMLPYKYPLNAEYAFEQQLSHIIDAYDSFSEPTLED